MIPSDFAKHQVIPGYGTTFIFWRLAKGRHGEFTNRDLMGFTGI
jgi:hypothetical protein